MICFIHRTRTYIVVVGLASLMILMANTAPAVKGPSITVRLLQKLPRHRVLAPQVRLADLQKNMFSPPPEALQPPKPSMDKEAQEIEGKQNLRTEQPVNPDQIEDVQVESKPSSVDSGALSVREHVEISVYNAEMEASIKEMGVNNPIRDKIWFFGIPINLKDIKVKNNKLVWDAYRKDPPSKVYVYQQQTVPDLTSIQDLEITTDGIQKPGFQLFPRYNGVVRVVAKNGITQFGGLYFQEDSFLRKIQEEKAVMPNDPYYMKGGRRRKIQPFKVFHRHWRSP
ncbi:MAG: hypothetical protein JRE40_15450 [Deltaproteobacteria bacterium]|nr:hypothetical protein [Deltaproteobacteria bacterium]